MNTIRILGHDYLLEYTKNPKTSGVIVRGYCDYQRQKIILEKTLTDDQHGEVLLHEVFHAISQGMNQDLTEEHITALGRGFWATVKDNPALLELIKDLAVTHSQKIDERKVCVSGKRPRESSKSLAASKR
jgi:sulfur relay (sulfurtransferase) DsrC/TusE family protein